MNLPEIGNRLSNLGAADSKTPSASSHSAASRTVTVRYLKVDATPTPIPPSHRFSPTHGTALICLCLALFLQGIQSRSLWASHEARAAQNAQSILETGEWLVPRLFDGTAELQKPAGFYWLVAGVGAIRGQVDEIAVRLPAIACGLFTVLAVWWWLCRQGRPMAGFIAGACMASAVHFTGTARIGRIDIPLTAAVTGMLLTLQTPIGRSKFTQLAIPSLFGALALLLKGPIGIVLVGGVWGVSRITNRSSEQTSWFAWIQSNFMTAGIAVTLAIVIAAPWFVAAHFATAGEFTKVFFWYHHVNRAFGGAEALAAHPWWFYAPRLIADFLPWTPLALIAVWRLSRTDREARFGLDWFVAMMIILSASRFKRADYLLPAYPALAIVVGCWAERWYTSVSLRKQDIARYAFHGILFVMPFAWFAFDRTVTTKEQASKDPGEFANLVRETAPAPTEVILCRVENHLLAYQLGRPVRTLTEWGDLIARWREVPSAVVVVRQDESASLREIVPFPVEIVADDRAGTPSNRHRPMVLFRRTP